MDNQNRNRPTWPKLRQAMIDQFDLRYEGAQIALPDLDSSISEALLRLRDAQFLKSTKYQEQQWKAVRNGAHSDILDFERLFVRKLKRLGVPMYAHNMVRTTAQQQELFVRGVTNAKGFDSPHPNGCAVDIVHSIRHWELTKAEWLTIGHIGKELAVQNGFKLVWGGDWKFYDPAHWELANWRSHAPVRAL